MGYKWQHKPLNGGGDKMNTRTTLACNLSRYELYTFELSRFNKIKILTLDVGYYAYVARNIIYLYFYDLLQVINFNSFNMQVCHIISCYVIFFYLKIFLEI
jgi:hypothetical protein